MSLEKLEKHIVAACLKNRRVALKLDSLGIREDLSVEARRVLDEAYDLYGADSGAEELGAELVHSAVRRKLSNPKHQELFDDYFRSLPEKVSEANILSEVAALKRHRVGQKLAGAIAANRDEAEIESLIDQYKDFQLAETRAEELTYPDSEEVFELFSTSLNRDNLIPFYPSGLADRLGGGAMGGDHFLVYARPEMGKTLFAVNLAAGFIVNGKRVLYCGNEEPIARTRSRLISRLVGVPNRELEGLGRDDLTHHVEKAMSLGYNRFASADIMEDGSLAYITSLVEQTEPDVLIVDQILNLEVPGDSRVLELEKAAQGMRKIAKSKDVLAISLTQAGDSAEGRSLLRRGDVYNSNTSIPGAVDVMIGIGATEEQEMHGVRFLSFPKNKLGSHDPLQVMFNLELNKVEEL